MIVRLARITDVSDILAFAKEALTRTNYRGFPFNAVIARRTLKRAMTDPNARVWVAERGGRIVGFLIGEIGEMPMTHFTSATDLAFLADAGGDLLLDAFVHWCILRKVARIDMGVSAGPARDAVMRRAMRIKGFELSGSMFHVHLGDSHVGR